MFGSAAAHRELIEDGRTGFLFRASDREALAASLLNVGGGQSSSLRAMREAARGFVERARTWRDSVARYTGVYEGIVCPSLP